MIEQKIIIYGVNDKEFPSEHSLIDYLSRGIFRDEVGKFRYTQCKNADIVVLSRHGLAYGHLIVQEKVSPSEGDIKDFPPVKCTYLISSTVVYTNSVKLFADLGIKVSSFGKYISEKEFKEMQNRASC